MNNLAIAAIFTLAFAVGYFSFWQAVEILDNKAEIVQKLSLEEIK